MQSVKKSIKNPRVWCNFIVLDLRMTYLTFRSFHKFRTFNMFTSFKMHLTYSPLTFVGIPVSPMVQISLWRHNNVLWPQVTEWRHKSYIRLLDEHLYSLLLNHQNIKFLNAFIIYLFGTSWFILFLFLNVIELDLLLNSNTKKVLDRKQNHNLKLIHDHFVLFYHWNLYICLILRNRTQFSSLELFFFIKSILIQQILLNRPNTMINKCQDVRNVIHPPHTMNTL